MGIYHFLFFSGGLKQMEAGRKHPRFRPFQPLSLLRGGVFNGAVAL